MLIHASCVAIHHIAVLLAGPAGIGKSDLALRLIDEGAQLIADDQALLTKKESDLIASAPESIRGLFEARHIGLLQMPFLQAASVGLYVDLVAPDHNIERLPEENFISFLNVKIRHLVLPSFAVSTPAKIRAALKYPLASR